MNVDLNSGLSLNILYLPKVALGFINFTSNAIDYRCGGTIISDRFILTAAQCVHDEEPVIVRVGVVDLNDRKRAEKYVEVFEKTTPKIDLKKQLLSIFRISSNLGHNSTQRLCESNEKERHCLDSASNPDSIH